MTAINWIVPARRVAIERALSYASLIDAWRNELDACRKSLKRWYAIDGDTAFDAGLDSIQGWRQAFFPDRTTIHAVRDGEVTIDEPRLHFKGRLWKGPLRVLLEAEHFERLIGPGFQDSARILDPLMTPWPSASEPGAQAPRLQLHATREVDNADAVFLAGDVVEFPLWKFLANCGLSDYGTAPQFDDVLTFNPAGSFLLGTSVADSAGLSPPVTPPLHDNRIAMRFQTVLSAFRAAFYHLDERVYDKDSWHESGKAISAEDNVPLATETSIESGAAPMKRKHTVYARGMMYAATLHSPRWRNKKILQPSYRFLTAGWCHDAYRSPNPPRNLPTRSSLNALPKGQPMTPGGVCSDTMLWLFNYMVRKETGKWGTSSVSQTVKNKTYYPLQDHYEYTPASEIEELMPETTAAEKIAELEDFADQIAEIRDTVIGTSAFWKVQLEVAMKTAPWIDHVRAKFTSKLLATVDSAYYGNPAPLRFMRTLRWAIRSTKGAEREVLMELHQRISAEFLILCQRVLVLMAGKAWKTFESEGPDFTKRRADLDTLSTVALCTLDEKCNALHGAKEVGWIAWSLNKKHKHIQKLLDNPSKIKPTHGGKVELSSEMTDLNTVTLKGHEWGVVKIRRLRSLLDEKALPTTGFMAAYEPLDGADCCPPTHPAGGQCFVFEESGSALIRGVKGPGGRKHALMGCTPHNWYPIPGNQFSIVPASKGGIHFTNAGVSMRKKTLRSITRLKTGDAGGDRLREIHDKAPREDLPIFVHPHLKWWGTDTGKRAFSRMVDSGQDLYASRAVPFPTLEEMRGVLPTVDEVHGYLDLIDEAAKSEEEVVPEEEVEPVAN